MSHRRPSPRSPTKPRRCARPSATPSAPRPSPRKRRLADTVVITHTDITRATPNDRILPLLLAELEAAGVRRDDITLLNALGTHRKQTVEELRRVNCTYAGANHHNVSVP